MCVCVCVDTVHSRKCNIHNRENGEVKENGRPRIRILSTVMAEFERVKSVEGCCDAVKEGTLEAET